jgi:hypothetical protein
MLVRYISVWLSRALSRDNKQATKERREMAASMFPGLVPGIGDGVITFRGVKKVLDVSGHAVNLLVGAHLGYISISRYLAMIEWNVISTRGGAVDVIHAPGMVLPTDLPIGCVDGTKLVDWQYTVNVTKRESHHYRGLLSKALSSLTLKNPKKIKSVLWPDPVGKLRYVPGDVEIKSYCRRLHLGPAILAKLRGIVSAVPSDDTLSFKTIKEACRFADDYKSRFKSSLVRRGISAGFMTPVLWHSREDYLVASAVAKRIVVRLGLKPNILRFEKEIETLYFLDERSSGRLVLPPSYELPTFGMSVEKKSR